MESRHLKLILIGILAFYPRTGALEKLDEPILFGPSVALDGSVEDFYCDIPGKPVTLSVQYEIYLETNPGKVFGAHSSLSGEIATFPLVITTQHDGRLICKASGHNDTDIESSYSKPWEFRVIVPVGDVSIISHSSIENMWEGQTLTLQCNKTKGTYVTYNWFRNNVPVQMPYDRNEDTLTIHRVSAQNTGNYVCVASNRYNDTTIFNSTSDVTVYVKEYVSKPEISMDPVKLENGYYAANITCQSKKGTPPITFSLLNYTDAIFTETTETTSAFFKVPIELNRYMGQVSCNASNEGNWVLSDPFRLIVESVGGAVTMTPLKHVDLDFQVVDLELRCKVEQGSFPRYSWFLNNSRLVGRGRFYAVVLSDESKLLLSVGRDSAGFYHCQASDRLDNSTSVHSPKMLINKEVLNTVPLLVVIVVFTSFALLNVALIACCIYGVVLRRRYPKKYPLIEEHRKMRITDKQEDEDEEDADYLMLEDFEEDAVQTDRMSDSAEDEDQSVDESVLYEGAVSE
ncbi:Fc receptor-like protein 5 [Labeo rohita]|uniref:Fc receptor-like protein 5 n=1 Tax=Labeo rohita TaxID=84645 RepID=UPI0021E31B8D|nr:Fc receptor-like protein 5 [Labeo rohita]